jgi:hypothetical protein
VYGCIDRLVSTEKDQGIRDHIVVDGHPGCPSALAPNLLKEAKARRLLIDRVLLAAILPVFMDRVLIPSVQVLDPKFMYAGVTAFTIQSDFIAIASAIIRIGADACQLQYRVGNDRVLFVIIYRWALLTTLGFLTTAGVFRDSTAMLYEVFTSG